jgi:hypothetical protein
MVSRRLRRVVLAIVVPILIGAVLLVLPLFPPIDLAHFPVPRGADSVVVVPGERYRAGAVMRVLLGDHWRALWTAPLTVAVLRLHDFDGGLLPIKEGGGLETRSLHFVSRTGHRYVFRSIDKELVRLFNYGLSRSLVARIVQDQTAASHPASALIAAPLQAALGLPFTHPRLVVLPADSLLGAYEPRFAGLLGTLQEAPGESLPDPAPVDPDIKETEAMLGRVDSVPGNRFDARSFLTARLLDFLMNDWDRHAGQWRWAAIPRDDGVMWLPIPVDRDQAFARYDGLLLAIARLRTTKLSRFGPAYPHLQGLIRNSVTLDRRLLAMLPGTVWDSVRGFVVARLSDAVIDSAMDRMPEVYRLRSAAMIAASLKERRGGLASIATEYYRLLARRPEVHVGVGDSAELNYQPDGSAELRVSGELRRFLPGETELLELRLYGGIEQLKVSGTQGGIEVRVLDSQGRELRPGTGGTRAGTAARGSHRPGAGASG